MQKFKLFFKIILPSILCVLLIYISNISLEYLALTFGFIIGLVNWNLHKHTPLFGILLSILVSFTSFLAAYFSFAVTGSILNFMNGDSGSILGLIISIYIIAPLLMFVSYKFVFDIPKTKYTKFTILITIALLVLQSYFFLDNENKFLNSHTIWQIIMALALQLIINQKNLLNRNN